MLLSAAARALLVAKNQAWPILNWPDPGPPCLPTPLTRITLTGSAANSGAKTWPTPGRKKGTCRVAQTHCLASRCFPCLSLGFRPRRPLADPEPAGSGALPEHGGEPD